jgi:phospholipid/cholesterol/gamma-HCH transport system ATP-binding protein
MIDLVDVEISFEGKAVLRGLNLNIEQGDTLVLLGPSGCGKSVTLKIILGLLKPDRGSVTIDGEELTRMSEDNLIGVRRKMGMVFQGGALFDSLKVSENVGFRLYEEGELDDDEIENLVREKLRYVDLEEAYDMMPADLSGGMKKRVAIARAISSDPEILLYDEPTTGLDPITARSINDLIIRLDRRGATSIVVTHELESAFTVAERICMIRDGLIVFDGTVEELKRSDDPWIRTYLA